jgi:hypothetical protein
MLRTSTQPSLVISSEKGFSVTSSFAAVLGARMPTRRAG